MIQRLLLLISAFISIGGVADAHPVAQGTMDLTLRNDRVVIHARVSNEQILVHAGFAKEAPATTDEAFDRHGEYILSRVTVAADGANIVGAVAGKSVPSDRTAKGFAEYDLAFPLAAVPREIQLRQSILNEIDFALGNPWEATFLMRITDARGSAPAVIAEKLFTHREMLVVPVPAIDSATVPITGSGIFIDYLSHGFHHILEGWDHLLFITALVLATRRWRELIVVVSVFTIAHTITLILSVCDIVRLSSHIVEPMIAASIVVIALQNALRPSAARGWLRLTLAFGFGLFHGLGFAGGLLEAMQELPGFSLGSALGGFSIGVELGHQVVVLPVFGTILLIKAAGKTAESRERTSVRILRGGSVLIALAGTFYLVSALRG